MNTTRGRLGLAAFLLSALILGGCSRAPDLKNARLYSGAAMEFRSPGNWKISQGDTPDTVLVESGRFGYAGLAVVRSNTVATRKQILASVLGPEEGPKTAVARTILRERTEGVRVDYQIEVDHVKVDMRSETYVAGPVQGPLVITLHNSRASWDRDVPGFDLVLESLKLKTR